MLRGNWMDYFLDTNVELGYVFCTDPWNTPAIIVFDSNDKLHYSDNVDKEFQKNLSIFLRQQRDFFYSVAEELGYLGLRNIGYNEFNSIGLSVEFNDFAENKKESCLKLLWDIANKKKKDKIEVKGLVRKIMRFHRNFEHFLLKRKTAFERKVMFHKRDDDYIEIFEELKNLGIHEEDNNIILDAHDLATTQSLNLDFVTSDNAVHKLPQQVSKLNINEFLHLRDFK